MCDYRPIVLQLDVRETVCGCREIRRPDVGHSVSGTQDFDLLRKVNRWPRSLSAGIAHKRTCEGGKREYKSH
jgi:hypothetical protein